MFTSLLANITVLLSNAILAFINLFVDFHAKLISMFTEKWNQLTQILKSTWDKFAQTVSNGKARILSIVSNMISSIGNYFKNLAAQAISWGSDMIQGFIDGVLAKWEALKETVSNVANTVKDYLGFSEPEKGPMKDFNSWPKHMMQNYASGIESMRFLVKNAVADVSADVAVLENPINSDEIYSAVRSGASDANVRLSIGDREFTRALRDMGVVFGG